MSTAVGESSNMTTAQFEEEVMQIVSTTTGGAWFRAWIWAKMGPGDHVSMALMYQPEKAAKVAWGLGHADTGKLTELFRALHSYPPAQGERPWTHVTVVLEKGAPARLDYGDEDWLAADYAELQEAWVARYLSGLKRGMRPRS